MDTFFLWSGVLAWVAIALFLVGLFTGSNTITFDPTIRNGKKRE